MTAPPAHMFRLELLGPPALRDELGQTPPGLGWGKPLALLALLAVRREMRRDEVVDLLWRDVPEDKARNAFRQALHRLRTAVGDEVLPQDRERLKLVSSNQLSVDIELVDNAVATGRIQQAAELYRGDFLEGSVLGEAPFDMWVEQERARFRGRHRQLLNDAITQCSASGRWSDAIRYAEQLLAIAPYETESARVAATTMISAGKRNEARALLERFAATLNAELGLPMPAELQAMLGRMERVEARKPEPAQARAGDAQLPFIGREAELSRLVSLCRGVKEEEGAFALVEGETGMGKTRLMKELAAHLRSLGKITVLSAREHPMGTLLPHAIFAEALQPLVRAPGVVGASKHLLAEAARLLPALRDEIELPQVEDVDDDAARLRFFEGVAALVDAAAFERPIVILLEDVHHVAPSTLELLSYLCVRLARSPVAFVLSVRAEDTPHATLARLRAFASAQSSTHAGRNLHLTLQPLKNDEASRALSGLAPATGVSESVIQRMVVSGGGVPGRLTQLLRQALSGESPGAVAIPAQGVAERLAGISSAQRRMVFVLAIIARPVDLRTIAAASHLPESAATDAVKFLLAEGFLERDGDRVAVAGSVAQIALEAAGPQTRAFLSGWAADALSETGAGAPAEIARLHAAAGAARPAFENYRRAAFSSLALGALPEASALLQSARTFAVSDEQQREVESLLTAIGSGRARIVSTPTASGAQAVGERPQRERVEPSGHSPGWQVLFPNWRALLGAAIATLVISAVVLALRGPAGSALTTRPPAGDTLLISEGEEGQIVRLATFDDRNNLVVSERRAAPPSVPAWIDSLARPWIYPVPSPTGDRVAVARVTGSGADVLLISADRRDTTALVSGRGDARPYAWSPDGRTLLVGIGRARSAESFDADLYAFVLRAGSLATIPIDTTPQRSIVEAAWSPDGSRIAWVARMGPQRQQDVFVSASDGSSTRNLSRHPAEDWNITWSPDGELLAFTSTRDGNSELYAASFREDRLWRLTFDPAQDGGGIFSSDSRSIAFESTRGGTAGVYVMPALGGEARRVAAAGNISLRGWTGGRRRFIDRVQVSTLAAGEDSLALDVTLFDQLGEPLARRPVDWRVLDSATATAVSPATGERLSLQSRRPGIARVVADVGRWRSDTAFVRIGDAPVTLIDAGLDGSRWDLLGTPAPSVDRSAIVLRADREWDSGVLSRQLIPIVPGLEVTIGVALPLVAASEAASSLKLSLVAPEDSTTLDRSAPQFLHLASFAWNAEAARFVYSAGREIFSESVRQPPPALTVRLRVETDSTFSVAIDDSQRWRSTLKVVNDNAPRAQIWIGGRATGDNVRVSSVRAILAARRSVSSP